MAADPVVVREGRWTRRGTSSSTCATACGRPAPLVGATMFGVTTPAVTETREPLEELGYGMLVLATGTGGRRAVGGRAEARPATALAERQLVMVGGQIAAERSATELQDDPDAQRRFLGVEPIATEE